MFAGEGWADGVVDLDAIRDAAAQRTRADVELTRLAVQVLRDQTWLMDACTSPQRWLGWRFSLDPADATSLVARGRLCVSLPSALDAMDAGAMSIAQADVLARAVTPDRADLAERDEELLVGAAKELDLDDYRRFVTRWRSLADDDLAAADAMLSHARRYLSISETLFGAYAIDGMLSADDGAKVVAAIDAATPPAAAGEQRTRSQARADGLVAAVAGGVTTSTTLVIDADALRTGVGRCEHDGATIGRDTARRHICDGSIARVAMAGRSEVLDVGRLTRTISPALRRALVVRDGGCTFPGCDQPHHRCEAHHVIHWANGGRTILVNLTLLCAHHHRAVHEGGFGVRRTPAGELVFTRPDGAVIHDPP